METSSMFDQENSKDGDILREVDSSEEEDNDDSDDASLASSVSSKKLAYLSIDTGNSSTENSPVPGRMRKMTSFAEDTNTSPSMLVDPSTPKVLRARLGKRELSRRQSFAPQVRNVLDGQRMKIIDSLSSGGFMGRRKLEAGFTLDVVHELYRVRTRAGEADYVTAKHLVEWVISEWPSDPPNSSIPADPAKLGEACRSMLDNYDPRGDSSDPENSAYLLPEGLRGIVAELDKLEKIGAWSDFRERMFVEEVEHKRHHHHHHDDEEED
jgi:hypothetical protein